MSNLFANLPINLPDELMECLVETSQVRIERIVSTSHASPDGFWYDQDEHEWVVLLQGAAKLTFAEGQTLEMTPGDHVLIPAHRQHRVDWTTAEQPTVWLAVFFTN